MDGKELHQWWISYQLEPFGDAREDLRMAILANTMVQLHAPKSIVKIEDFLPDFYKAYRPKVNQKGIHQSQQAFILMTRMVGGTVVRPGDVSA